MNRLGTGLAAVVMALGAALGCGGDDPDDIEFEVACGNGIDEDGDGLLDCADPDCAADALCTGGGGPIEICDNGFDDDGDGRIDCGDGDCSSDPSCLL
ncbi:hypothetical protein [Vulgatibacter sp.]|uniref:hypothetical protein n=1 Tax=Vulgatibacter sp. TaxID=1971226 RepID=UPI00356B371F